LELDSDIIKRISENTIVLGADAEEFLRSDVGQYILARSEQEIIENLGELRNADPTEQDEIRKLQGNINVAEKAVVWLQQAIEEGKEEFRKRRAEEEDDVP
jgi:hypothetical protein